MGRVSVEEGRRKDPGCGRIGKSLRFLRLVFMVFGAALLMGAEGTGCQFLDNPEEFLDGEASAGAKFVLSVHEIVKYPRGGELEQEVDSYFGKSVVVNRSYYLHSKDIADIEVVKRLDNGDFYDLKLTLSPRGVKMWSAFAVLTRVDGKDLALLIDGIYYRPFKPSILLDAESNVVTVEGPFDPATASGLMKNAKRNFRKWNDK
ncbi:MAG: hypothetical protein J6331_05770 [Lentisphaeria bacterium]|nr:hypothetical protein [Lentisphaeria bacterium]